MKVYDPSGAMEITEFHARRLDSLEGKTICELSNDSWQAHRVFRRSGGFWRNVTPRPNSSLHGVSDGQRGIDTEKAAELVARAGAQAVLIGNAS